MTRFPDCLTRPLAAVIAASAMMLAPAALADDSAPAGSPVAGHGALSVAGNRIVDESGEAVSLAGVSWFWSTVGWGAEKWYTEETVAAVAEEFDASLIRAAISVEPPGGYLSEPDANIAMAETLIEAAIDQGLYVIVDWHSHAAERNPAAAEEFFTHIAGKYGDHPNVIYEIYNEPLNNTDWASVIKPYAERLVATIRGIDPDNLIVVGTQTWSQDVDKAAADPVTGYDNIAYTLHFYAGTHKAELRAKAQSALDQGIALFVTEWGTVNANGDGGVDVASVAEWMDFIRENELSHANWSLHDKEEGASILKPGTAVTGGWSEADYTASGRLVRDIVRGRDE